jgi:predicted ATPase
VSAYGQDSGVICLSYEAFFLWFLGYPNQALERIREALTLARELSHPATTVTVASIACWVYQLFRDGQATLEQAEAAISLSTDREFEFWRAMGEIMRGWALTQRGLLDDGIARIRMGMSSFRSTRSTGGEIMLPYFMYLLAEAYGRLGRAKEGLITLTEAQVAIDSSGERWWEAELQRLKGELILMQPDTLSSQGTEEAEACFHHALATARAQSAKSLELRAAISLSRLLQKQGKPSEARDILTSLYEWFTEGFDTTDLREARELIEQFQAE